jgi:quinol monooxygenase YgiN
VIKHIIVWRLKPEAHGNPAAENARLIKQKLEALRGRIPGLLKIEVGIDISRGGESGDLVLYSEFADEQALEAYKVHPEHKAVFPFIAAARADRIIVDYVTD